jgi:hypothetical protein
MKQLKTPFSACFYRTAAPCSAASRLPWCRETSHKCASGGCRSAYAYANQSRRSPSSRSSFARSSKRTCAESRHMKGRAAAGGQCRLRSEFDNGIFSVKRNWLT